MLRHGRGAFPISPGPASPPAGAPTSYDVVRVYSRTRTALYAIIPAMSTTAVIYARISRDREGAGLGVDRQLQDCRELADRLGLTVGNTFRDDDTSAYSGKPRKGDRKSTRLNSSN